MDFEIEKDWITEAGLRAVVILVDHEDSSYFIDRYHRCGYVEVKKGHHLFLKSYNDIDLDDGVHGGLTYSTEEINDNYPVKSNGWWFGFDCAHYKDTLEKCNLEYVINECESLAKQLKEVE